MCELTRRITLAAGLILGVATGVGCGKREEPLSPSPPQIKVVPMTTTVGLGQTVLFTVEVTNLSTVGGFLWRTTDEAVVRVSAAGEATGASKGRAFILVKLAADTSMTARAEVIVQ